jgi:signal peptidase II
MAAVAGVVLVLDMLTKAWADSALRYGPSRRVLGDIVRLTYVRNPGVAFGLGAGLPIPYAIFSLAAIAAILYMVIRRPNQHGARLLSLALILGGAIGNLIDRVRAGEVVDFIDIGFRQWRWPVFNVADSAVTVGVVLFAFTWPRHRAPEAEPQSAGESREPATLVEGAEHGGGGEARPLPGGRPH